MSALSGQFAVVTGASGAIGAAIAAGLVKAGVRVCAIGRNREHLERLGQSASMLEGSIVPLVGDLEDESGLHSICAGVHALSADVHLLVHAAGRIYTGNVQDAPIAHLDEQYRLNVRAPYALTQALLPSLRRTAGQVVFVNSTVGTAVVRGGIAQYAASKHALKAIADSLRFEVNADGMRVLTVFPSNTASSMYQRLCASEGKPYKPEQLMQPEDIASTVIAALSLPRSAEVTDIQMRPLKRS